MQFLQDNVYRLLRRSEQTFKTDMVYIAKGGLWTGFRFGIGIIASAMTMIAFGNLLPKENYGTYSYLLSLASSLGFLTLSGIGPATTRAVAQGKENLIRHALRLQLQYNLLAVATIGAAAIYYGAKGNALFALSLGILAVAVPMESAFHIYEHILIGRKRFGLLAVLTGLSTLGAAVATVIVLIFTDEVATLVGVYALMSLGPSLLLYYSVEKKLPLEKPDEKDLRELKHSAFHITGAGIVGAVAQYIDKIVLFQVAGPASLAIYGFAIAGPERLKSLAKNWIGISLPRLSEKSLADIRESFYKRIGLSLLAGLGMTLVYIVLAPILFKLFLPKYLDSIRYSQVYALGLILIPALVYIGNIFYSQNMIRAIYISSTGTQILRIILFLILGLLWQTWGLVMAYLSFQLLSVIFAIFIWERESRRLQKLSSENYG